MARQTCEEDEGSLVTMEDANKRDVLLAFLGWWEAQHGLYHHSIMFSHFLVFLYECGEMYE